MAVIKSGTQILMDYNMACSQAEKLERAATSIRKECNRFEDCKRNVSAAWKGENATKFTGKMVLVADDLLKIAKSLEQAAEVIRKNAKIIYEADMKAKNIAETRTYM